MADYEVVVFNFLLDTSDPKSQSPRGRLLHGLFCLIMATGSLAFIVIGGWIATVFFRGVLLFSVTLLGGFADADGQLSAWVWIPTAGILLAVWLIVVALPVLWAMLCLVGACFGVASAVRPSLAEKPTVIAIANAAADFAIWVGRWFTR
ncbi:MAG: hypothetical protein AAF672_16595 [Pseudomonadota bacterium]